MSDLNVTSTSWCRWDTRFLCSYIKNLGCTISQPQHKHCGCLVMPAKINIMFQSNWFFIVAALVRDFLFIYFGFCWVFWLSFRCCSCFGGGGGKVLFKMLLIIKIYNLLILEISLINMATFSAYRHGGVFVKSKASNKNPGFSFPTSTISSS